MTHTRTNPSPTRTRGELCSQRCLQTSPRLRVGLVLPIVAGLLTGCAHSRWALSDRDYLAKYGSPDEQNAGWKRKLKQASDARFLTGRTGLYLGAGSQVNPQANASTVGGEAGVFNYVNHSLETHGGLSLLAGTGDNDVFVGGNAGARLQAPSRVAPFVGLGGFVGNASDVGPAEDDDIDNDNDDATDEDGETKIIRSDWLAAVYPELGVHFWINPRVRLTASASYYVTTAGRDTDFMIFGLNVGFLPREGRYVPQPLPEAEFDDRALPPSSALPPAAQWQYVQDARQAGARSTKVIDGPAFHSDLTPILNEAMKAPNPETNLR